jgi:hypothetical protein
MPSSEWILFGLNVDRIRNDSDEVAWLARALARYPTSPENWRGCDLERSIRNLREAADKLDIIRDRLGMPELELEDA